MSRKRAVLLLGLALIALGFVIGLVPSHVGEAAGGGRQANVSDSAGGNYVNCGTPFITRRVGGDSDRSLTSFGAGECESVGGLATRRAWSLGLLAAGLVLAIGSAMVRETEAASSEADRAEQLAAP
jgi:hypothetical protein